MLNYYIFTKEDRVFDKESIKIQKKFKIEDAILMEINLKVGDELGVKEFEEIMLKSFKNTFTKLSITQFWEICHSSNYNNYTFALSFGNYLSIDIERKPLTETSKKIRIKIKNIELV